MSDSPVLLTGHLLFLGGLCLLAWLSWPRETRLFFLGWRMSPLVLTSLIGGWSLLGVALTELAATDSLNGRLEVSDWSWLAGGAAFASGLMLTGYFAGRMGFGERQNLFLPAAILTSLGLIVIYHWEARTGSGHMLFFTQAGAAVIAMAAFFVVASAVARARLRAPGPSWRSPMSASFALPSSPWFRSTGAHLRYHCQSEDPSS